MTKLLAAAALLGWVILVLVGLAVALAVVGAYRLRRRGSLTPAELKLVQEAYESGDEGDDNRLF